MRFVFVSFLFLVDDFDLSVSSVTRNRADQPIRPSACAKQCQERTHCAARERLRYGTLVVLLSGEQLSVAEETVRCRLSVSSAIQMRGSISNCQSRRHSSLRKSQCLLRIALQQMLGNASRALGNYMAVFIEANHDDPIVDVSWPLAVWQ